MNRKLCLFCLFLLLAIGLSGTSHLPEASGQGKKTTQQELEDLQRMLSPQEQEALWKYPQLRQYHASADWSPFARITPFDTALARRYGAPRSLADYVAKAQLDNYDNVRAHRLPPELQDKNPTGTMWRFVDGTWTTKDI